MFPYFSILTALVGYNTSALHFGSGNAHVDGRYLLYALPFIGTVVYAFRSVLCGKIAVCNIRPRLPPYLGFLLTVPVNRINLAALKCAVFQFDTLTVLGLRKRPERLRTIRS